MNQEKTASLTNLIKAFTKNYRGKNLDLYLYYFEEFTSLKPNFHRLKDRIFEETGIVISSIGLHKIKMLYKNKSFVKEEVERRQSDKVEADKKVDLPKSIEQNKASEKEAFKTFGELGISFSDPSSAAYLEKHKTKYPFMKP